MAARAPRRPRRPPPPRRDPPAPRRTPRGSHVRRRIAALLALALLGAALYALNATFQPFHGDGEGSVQVSVPEGATRNLEASSVPSSNARPLNETW